MSASIVVRITVEHEAACLTCEDLVRFGETAHYAPGVGVWHLDCHEPRNLQAYWDEARRRKALGL